VAHGEDDAAGSERGDQRAHGTPFGRGSDHLDAGRERRAIEGIFGGAEVGSAIAFVEVFEAAGCDEVLHLMDAILCRVEERPFDVSTERFGAVLRNSLTFRWAEEREYLI
jgi:hypothetical protein